MTVELRLALTCVLVAGCRGDSSANDDDTESSTSGDPSLDSSSSSSSDPSDPSGASEPTSTGEVDSTDDGVDEPDPVPPDPPLPCDEEFSCKEDEDNDGKPISCDNASQHSNADQGDMDYDSIGDVVDLCPTVQTLLAGGDSDNDGVGNSCDSCRLSTSSYNVFDVPSRYEVRNTPHQADTDRDGIGDACDNCPLVPNCLEYGDGPGLTPYEVGMPLDPEDTNCNHDIDLDGIGDACEGDVGFADDDDFDGDGLDNGSDPCPRIHAGAGGHPDPDGDLVGSECDVCPFVADATQTDSDGDFIGDACEENEGCIERENPRPLAFYDVSVAGYCCTTYYTGQAFEDPDGMPLSLEDFPASTPGLLELPPGCEDALADAGVVAATALQPADVGGLDDLWPYMCLLPQWDQDLDAIPDVCDFCAFAFDPLNTPYTDANGMLWENYGAYCNGAYACDAVR